MITLRIIALIGLITGFFILCRISIADIANGIFGKVTGGPKGIRESILEETKRKKKSWIRREIDEVMAILEATDKTAMFPRLCTLSVILFACGAVFAALTGNVLLIPVMAVGMMFIPFWYVKLSASHFKKNISSELETALSVITTAYIRNEDLLTSIEENVGHLNPPVRTAFEEFVTRVKMVNPDMQTALDELKGKIKNEVFEEWIDAMKACQYDRSLKVTLVPIVAKLSDMRVVNGELDYLVQAPRKEFITMVVLVLSNIPLMYFLNKDWYHTLMYSVGGRIMLAFSAAAIFISTAFVIKLTKPIEYRS